jgi:hypothetical protein
MIIAGKRGQVQIILQTSQKIKPDSFYFLISLQVNLKSAIDGTLSRSKPLTLDGF